MHMTRSVTLSADTRLYLPSLQMAADPKLSKDLFLQATDGSQCVSWTGSQLTYLGRDCKELPSVLINLYGSAATRIDLSYCCLHSLKGLEAFKNLEEVILDNNCLSDEMLFPPSMSVTTLSLNKNRFERIDGLLRKLSYSYPNLRFLSLLGNPGYPDHITRDSDDSQYKRYRQLAIHLFPSLSFLDSRKITKGERIEALKRAQSLSFLIKPSEHELARHDVADDVPLTELNDSITTMDQNPHSAAFGKLKYRYTGKHSEGNRFIRNSQL